MNANPAHFSRLLAVLALVVAAAHGADKNQVQGAANAASRLPQLVQEKEFKGVAPRESLTPQLKLKTLEAAGIKIDTSQLERPFVFTPAAPRVTQGGLYFFNPVSYSTANRAGTEKGVVQMHTDARPGMGSILAFEFKAYANYRYIVDVWVKTPTGGGQFDLLLGGEKSVISANDGHITLVVGPYTTQTEVSVNLEGREGTNVGNWEFHRCEITPVKAPKP